MQNDLKRIKDKYGEDFSHLCRELFPTILETEGLLPTLIESKFYFSKFLYTDIIVNDLVSEFQSFINSLIATDNKKMINTNKSPYELLDEAGYILYECKTNKDIQKFKKYYKSEEKLCTFNDNRLKTNYVFFAVKKNVSSIKRENYTNPKRQDEYGTSVISIQFTRGDCNYVSIKNRYNHTVDNPDSTFGNNLDNIIVGLTQSFEREYNLNIGNTMNGDFELPDYVLATDGKFYKYNYEINNIYYCPDNIIIKNFKPLQIKKDRYIVFDYFLLDMKEKSINLCDNNINDSFTSYNENIENVEITKLNNRKYIILKKKNHQIVIVIDKANRMLSYYNDLIFNIDDNFLRNNIYLETMHLGRVKNISDNFMQCNVDLKYIEIPFLQKCGSCFLNANDNLKEVSFSNLKYVGDKFLVWNSSINNIYLPMLRQTGNYFMTNANIKHLELPNLVSVTDGFMSNNKKLSELYAPCLEQVGSKFLEFNNNLIVLKLPSLKRIGCQFLSSNMSLRELRLPSLEKIDDLYLTINEVLETVEMPADIIDDFMLYSGSFKNNFREKQKKLTLIKTS